MDTVEQLKNKRDQIKAQLFRFSSFVETMEDTKIIELQARLDRIEFCFNEFHKVQCEIELLDTEENNSNERESFEDSYYSTVAAARSKVMAYHARIQALSNNQQAQGVSAGDGHSIDNTGGVKLPILNLPKFYGDYVKWRQFCETFQALVDNNSKLDKIQKFYYLLDCLKGDAEKVLMSLEVTRDNYTIAWNLLKKRFENKPIIIQTHLKALVDSPVLFKESSQLLQRLADTIERNMRALKALGEPIECWDRIIVFLMVRKLDSASRKEWEEKTISDFAGLPKLLDFTTFLANRSRILENVESGVGNKYSKLGGPKKGTEGKVSLVSTQNIKCEFCKGSHFVYKCEKLLQLAVSDRIVEVKKCRLCLNCLRSNHFLSHCKAEGCKRCKAKHNTLLHLESSKGQSKKEQDNGNDKVESRNSSTENVETNDNIENISVATHCMQINRNAQIILSTALVYIKDGKNNFQQCRALLDSGSQSNFISAKLVNKLKLKTWKIRLPVSGVNQTRTNIDQSTQTQIKSIHNNFIVDIPFLVLEQITSNIPVTSFDISTIQIPKNVTLADPYFNISTPIDILLGASIFYEMLCVGQIKLGIGQPILQKSLLGWLISGALNPIRKYATESISCHSLINVDIQDQLERFWNVEECIVDKFYSKEEAECEKDFRKNVTRDFSGRFTVKLPLRDNSNKLGDSLEMATKRFLSLEKRLEKNINLKKEYCKFITEYCELGHMEKIDLTLDRTNPKNVYYLPHHAVINDNSVTTNLRVVFDASAKTDNGVSLNDILMVGPNLQDELFDILIRFRKRFIAMTGDIAKMYSQVLVSEEHRDLQRIIWRESRESELEHFRLKTVTYGTGPASYLATRCLHQVAFDIEKENPPINKIILKDFYVDDLITGADSVEEAKNIGKKLSEYLSKYGFLLRKWASNREEVLEYLSDSKIENIGYFITEGDKKKTLGIFWNAKEDNLEYVINKTSSQSKGITKRMILSIISQIFDPLGLVGPTTIKAKLILQQLWRLKLDWDESIPIDLYTSWSEFYNQLGALNDIKIPRHVLIEKCSKIQIHGFCDASEKAYGACLYLKSQNDRGESKVQLLCAKSRVAPLKVISLPRLELCGAVLLVRLLKKSKRALDIKINEIFVYTDSTIVLSWLTEQPSNWKTFVANRVAEIQNSIDIKQWRHVSSGDNPADIISRGTTPKNLVASTLWWSGPEWLTQEVEFSLNSAFNSQNSIEMPERKNIQVSCININIDDSIFARFSRLHKLQRVVALCIRFFKNLRANKDNRIYGNVSTLELENALVVLVRLMQRQEFQPELRCFEKSEKLPSNSKIKDLDPFLDEVGLLRVGGRLKKSKESYNVKFPIVLPQKHQLTKLIILDQHHKQLHAGAQAILCSIRQNYWPINGRSAVRGILSKCVTCFRVKPSFVKQKMGDLPKNRIVPSRPFSSCGIDYAGPFQLKDGKLRNRALVKGYLCIFVCFSTKAVHLELVGDLSTDSFLNCLKRFVSRRGLCSDIWSDNATNFKGANNELQKISEHIVNLARQDVVSTFFTQRGIIWHNIPARSPHQGGLWESAIKAAKYHVSRTIGKSSLTYEELLTVFTQVEAAMNSRPLTPLSQDPNDLQALTPGHFLIGNTLTSLPQRDVQDISSNRLARYEQLQQMFQHFWARWSREYLGFLQQRSKWQSKENSQLSIGALVLLKETTPPLSWKLGRVIALHPGQDKLVRVVSVRTTNGVVKRAVQNVCVLPVE